MRYVQLTPGTGNFYCGSCLRDNAMVNAFRARGHDAIMVPMYLPTVTDEPEATGGSPIFFGGINVYLQQKFRLFRNTPRWLDKFFNAEGLLRWSSNMSDMTSPRELGELTVSMVKGEEGKQNKELDKLIEWLRDDFKPEVIGLSNALLYGLAKRLKAELNVPLIGILQGEDAFLDSLPEPYRSTSWKTLSERTRDLDQLIAVSHYYGKEMQERLSIPDSQLNVVHNGILLDGYEVAAVPPQHPTIGYLARMCPGKGLGTLIDAFIALKKRPGMEQVKLRVAGSQTASDKKFVATLITKLKKANIAEDVEFLPNVSRDEKLAFLQSLTMLSVPATYGESFGLFVIEALATGVPVVQPRHAAFPELIDMTNGGILCDPDDAEALADGFAELINDPDRARDLGRQGHEAVLRKFGVENMADGVQAICNKVMNLTSVEEREVPVSS